MPLDLHKHQWMNVKTSYYDRYNWISIERCRKCSLIEQCVWTIRMENGAMNTRCKRSKVMVTNTDEKEDDIGLKSYNDTIPPSNA